MSAASSAAPMISLVFSIWSATGIFGTRPRSDPTGPVRGWGAAARMLASSSAGWVALRYLGRGRRSGRRPDDQIGLGHIQPGIKQAGDDADLPRIACRSATTEDQRSLARGARPPYGVDLPLILVGPRPVAVPWRVDRGDREPVAATRRPPLPGGPGRRALERTCAGRRRGPSGAGARRRSPTRATTARR